MKEYGMYQNYNVEASMTQESMEANTPSCGTEMSGCTMPEVTECVKEKQVHRTICHTVPHVCPVHTRIINHHIYRHIYRPCYTCSEENVIENVDPGCCNMF